MTARRKPKEKDWRKFVIDHGHLAAIADLAFILRQPAKDIQALRDHGVCTEAGHPKRFAALFEFWHGREPADADWPPPRPVRNGEYEWQGPELALLASLVGRLGKEEIASALTARLKELTGDPLAHRGLTAVQNTIARIGMQSGDVVGGITVSAAGQEIGSLAMVNQAIHKGDLRASKVGRRWVIPHKAWSDWKAGRVFPPEGYVQLSTLRQTLSVMSDKLSEYARMGYVPTAIRCNPYGTGLHSTQFGTWYISPQTAEQLVADRQAGRPMPWHGKPMADNLRATHRLWLQRKHPAACKTCAGIWRQEGAPASFADYAKRYPSLAHGAKRHLTLPWTKGLNVADIARKAGCSTSQVHRAIDNGTLEIMEHDGAIHATRTDATRWISRGCPAGESVKSWISLATATKATQFSEAELMAFVKERRLKSKMGAQGAQRGVFYVSRQQCATLREQIGFTAEEAARRAGVPVPRFLELLQGVDWRGTGGIPLVTVQAVIKRLSSTPGYTVEEAAEALGRDTGWVEERVRDGTVRPLRTKGKEGRLYLSAPMLQRLRTADANPRRQPATGEGWLGLGEAALEAGVTTTTVQKWANQGELERVQEASGWRYPRDAVRGRARTYWQTARFLRAVKPKWLQAEAEQKH